MLPVPTSLLLHVLCHLGNLVFILSFCCHPSAMFLALWPIEPLALDAAILDGLAYRASPQIVCFIAEAMVSKHLIRPPRPVAPSPLNELNWLFICWCPALFCMFRVGCALIGDIAAFHEIILRFPEDFKPLLVITILFELDAPCLALRQKPSEPLLMIWASGHFGRAHSKNASLIERQKLWIPCGLEDFLEGRFPVLKSV